MILTTFKSVTHAWVAHEEELSWEDLVKKLSYKMPNITRDKVPLFNLVKFKEKGDPTLVPGNWGGEPVFGTRGRCKANMVYLSGMVLDIDGTFDLEEAITHFSHYEFFIYSTFNHTANSHRFRVVLPFTEDIKAEDFLTRVEDMKRVLLSGVSVDHASFTQSQSFYYHCGHNDSFTYHNTGKFLEPMSFKVEIVPPAVQRVNAGELTDTQKTEYQQRVLKSLQTCSGMHYAGTTTTNGILTLVSICKSIELSYDQFDSIAAGICAADSCVTDQKKRLEAWNKWKGDKITAAKRDKFISSLGGEVIQSSNKVVELDDNILNELKLKRKKK